MEWGREAERLSRRQTKKKGKTKRKESKNQSGERWMDNGEQSSHGVTNTEPTLACFDSNACIVMGETDRGRF